MRISDVMPIIRRFIRILLFAITLSPLATAAAGLAPWQFGMTPAQVRSFKEVGPYKAFSNGDLETFNGRFKGRKENIQFFFERGRLRRIGVYFGETSDPKKAVAMFERAYRVLQQDYGKIEVPEMKVSERRDAPDHGDRRWGNRKCNGNGQDADGTGEAAERCVRFLEHLRATSARAEAI